MTTANIGIGIGADANNDGIITYADVGNYLGTVTRAQAETTGGALKIKPDLSGWSMFITPSYLQGEHSTSRITDAHANALGLTWVIDYHNYIAQQASTSAAENIIIDEYKPPVVLSEEQITALGSTNNNDAAALEVSAEQEEAIQTIEDSQFDDEINQQIAELSKSRNVPLRKITDNGPVKVLGTGFNSVSIKWNGGLHNIGAAANLYLQLQGWDRWNDFPTLVQIGDLVWAWRDTYKKSGGDYHGWYKSRWQLVDIRLSEPATNVAYPPPANNSSINPLTYQIGESVGESPELETLQPPAYFEYVTSQTAGNDSDDVGDWSKGYHTDRVLTYAIPTFEGGDITHYKIGGVSGAGQYVNGMGGEGYLIDKGGTMTSLKVAMFFPPIRYKWQFEKLYGKEEDWYVPQQTKIWDVGTYKTGIAPYYAYEFPEPPASSFRDIAGDNTGNGVDDSAIAKIKDNALATGIGLASGVLATGILKKISNCGLDINTQGLNDTLDSFKSSIGGAVDASGLGALAAKAQTLKTTLTLNLPKIPELPDFSTQLAALKMQSEKSVAAFKEKWGNAVDKIDDIVDKVKFDPGNFDICSVKDIKAELKLDEKGAYVKALIPTKVEIPQNKPDELIKTVVILDEAAEKAQSPAEEENELNPKKAKEGMDLYVDAWAKLYKDKEVIAAHPTQEEIEEANDVMKKMTASRGYKQFRNLVNNKKSKNINTPYFHKFIDKEKEFIPILAFAKKYRFINNNARRYMTNQFIKSAVFYYNETVAPDSREVRGFMREAFPRRSFRRVGELYLDFRAVVTVYTQEDYERELAYKDLINKKIVEYIWKIDVIKAIASYGIVHPAENTSLVKEEAPENTDPIPAQRYVDVLDPSTGEVIGIEDRVDGVIRPV